MATGSEATALWFTAPRCAEFRPAEVLTCSDRDIKVEALYSAPSLGTEMLVYRGQVPDSHPVEPATVEGDFSFPIKYGYSNVGTVVEAGKDTDFHNGDLVFVRHPHQDIFSVDSTHATVLPPYSDPAIAVFLQLLDVAVNTLLDCPVRIGDIVVVFGQGVVGTFAAQLAKRTAGTVVTVDPYSFRRELSLEFGADYSVDPASAHELVMDVSEGRGADLSIEASGSPSALQTAIISTGFEGTIVVPAWYGTKELVLTLGPEFHLGRQRIVSSQVNVIGSGLQPRWTVERRLDVAKTLLPTLNPDKMISHRIPFTAAPDGYRLIDERPETLLSVVFEYTQNNLDEAP